MRERRLWTADSSREGLCHIPVEMELAGLGTPTLEEEGKNASCTMLKIGTPRMRSPLAGYLYKCPVDLGTGDCGPERAKS